jgi:hypothetical protein
MNEPPNPEVAVFAEALELPADQRGAFLDQACAGDVALRRQVATPFQVVAKYGVGLHAVLQTAQLQVQFRGCLLRKGVNHPFLVALCSHQAVGPQVGELLGNGDLRQPQNILEMTNTKRDLLQEVEDAKTSFIAKTPINLQQFHILR